MLVHVHTLCYVESCELDNNALDDIVGYLITSRYCDVGM